MGSIVRGLMLALMAATGLAADAGDPASIGDHDVHAIRGVVEAQLKALAADDAVLAFSYASPSVRMQFGDPGSFISMVREGYSMLIRPSDIAFLQPQSAEGGVAQPVYFRDEEGRTWLATYQMQRQPDKSWRINGCVVEAEDGKFLI
jgi:hypothetical protein